MNRKIILLIGPVLFFALLFSLVETKAQSIDPQLPQIYLETKLNSATGKTINAQNTEEFNSALQSAEPGDEIVLLAGETYIGPFTLPNKNGNGMIIIRSSNVSGLPTEGSRVSPSDAANMPKIVSPGKNQPALKAAPGAHHYRIIGVEFAKATETAVVGDLVMIGTGDSSQSTWDSVPHDIILDRVYIHGNETTGLKRCLALNSAHTAVIDSHISDCHSVGQDSQAIGAFNGPGPFKIVNNYLEGAGENVLFGGADPEIPNLVPADIEFRNNLVSKPMSWRQKDWTEKNLFELKNAKRVLIEGNTFENSWKDGQTGFAVLFTPRNQSGGCPWCVVSDVTFQNNVVRHAASGISILGHDYNHPSQLTDRIKIYNNVFEDIDGDQYGGSGWLFLITSGTKEAGPANVQIINNTAYQTGNVITADGFPSPGFVFKNNLVMHNKYGVIGNSAGIGNGTLNKFFPASVFVNNALIGGSAKSYSDYPGNFFPASMSEAAALGVGANLSNPAPVVPTPSPTPAVPPGAPSPINSPVVLGGSSQSIPVDGTLVLDKGAIYVMEAGLRRPFVSMPVFLGLGYQLSNVRQLDAGNFPQGNGIFTSEQRHPRGSLVNDRGTVYFLGESARYPFPSAEVFHSWGHNFKDVIGANPFDLAIPIGPIVQTK